MNVPAVFTWAGDATQTTVEISAHAAPAVGLALAVSASPDMSAATVHTTLRSNAAGWMKWHVTDLQPATQYFHRLVLAPVGDTPRPVGPVSRFSTLRPVGVPCTTRIAVGSCQDTSPTVPWSFDDIVAWAPDRMMQLGDFGYPNYLSRDPATHMRNWAINCADDGVRRVLATCCMDYVISDHDDNGSGISNRPTFHDPITMANLKAWQEVAPARMEDTESPVHGRWRAEVEATSASSSSTPGRSTRPTRWPSRRPRTRRTPRCWAACN